MIGSGSSRGFRRVSCLLVVAGLVAVACGGDDSSDAVSDPVESDDVVSDPVESDDAVSDPVESDELASGPVECLAPAPLAERVEIRYGMGNPSEAWAPWLLADALGEFEAENIGAELVQLPQTDGLTALATGTLEVYATTPAGGFFNAVNSGLDIRAVAPSGLGGVAPGGFFVRKDVFDDPENPNLEELRGRSIATLGGLTSVLIYPTRMAFAEVGMSLDDVTFESLGAADLYPGLVGGVVDAAYLVAPASVDAEQSGEFVRMFGIPEDESLTIFAFGTSLLEADPEVGAAVLRAVFRTQRTHLEGNYRDKPDVIQALADEVGVSTDVFPADAPYLTWMQEFNKGTYERVQETFIEIGDILEYDTPLAFEEFADEQFAEMALAGC